MGHLGTSVEVNSQYSHQMTAARFPDKQLILSVWEPRVGRRAALGIWWSWLVLAQAIYLAAFGFIAVLLAIRVFHSQYAGALAWVLGIAGVTYICTAFLGISVIPSRSQPISRNQGDRKEQPARRKQPLPRLVCEERSQALRGSASLGAHPHLWLSQRQSALRISLVPREQQAEERQIAGRRPS